METNNTMVSPNKRRMVNDTDENMCLLPIDNSHHLLNTMKQLYTEKLMCDVYLKVGNKEHAAHRLILCASSDVFQAMFMKPEWCEWHESKVVLQELPHCEKVFHQFLEYFYTGQIIITHFNVMPILSLADKYMVKSLTNICVNYMCKHVPHAALHNQLFSWLQYTIACDHFEAAQHCHNYIKWNLEAIANTPDFTNFEVEIFTSLLKESDLIVYSEMVLYNLVVRWLELQKVRLQQSGLNSCEIDRDMEILVEMTMNCIRFAMLQPRELAELLLSPWTNQYKEFFVEKMTQGMTFHSGQDDRIADMCATEEGKLSCTPRLYTSDSWSTVLSVENFSSIPNYHTCTMLFSSHMSASEQEADRNCEWVVDLYPKGVWFKKFFLIVWQGTLEVPEKVMPTVRLSLTCQNRLTDSDDDIRVRVGILLYGLEGGIEHIIRVIEKVHHFSATDRVLNFDDLLPFGELNPQANEPAPGPSIYLIGPRRDTLRINIVITPLTANCCTSGSSSTPFNYYNY